MDFLNIQEKINTAKLNISKDKILYNEPMKKYTTFRIGGNAECLIKIDNKEDLKEIIEFSKKEKIPITIIGNGSNVLVLDGGIKGITLMIKLEEYKIIEQRESQDIIVEVDAGCRLGLLGQIFLKEELTGFEEISGIPGTFGGAIKMNAGAYGKEMKDITEEVTVLDYYGNEKIIKKEELEFGYRTSLFKNKKYIILKVKIKLKRGKEEEIKAKMQELKSCRIEKQPIEYPNAGSTFKRGEDFITAKLIEDAGLKGYTIGGAMVSTKHSGFVINKNNASSKDVLNLVKYIEDKVEEKFGKKIELEIEIIGEE